MPVSPSKVITQDVFDKVKALQVCNVPLEVVMSVVERSDTTVRYIMQAKDLDEYHRIRDSHDPRQPAYHARMAAMSPARTTSADLDRIDRLMSESEPAPMSVPTELVVWMREMSGGIQDISANIAELNATLKETNGYLFRMAKRQEDAVDLIKRLLAAWEPQAHDGTA